MLNKEFKDYDDSFNKGVSTRLKQIRKDNRYSAEKFAELLNINYPCYYTYEAGTRSIPMSVLRKVCGMFNIDFIEEIRKIDENISSETEETGQLGENN